MLEGEHTQSVNLLHRESKKLLYLIPWWVTTFENDTPSVRDYNNDLYRGCIDFNWNDLVLVVAQ